METDRWMELADEVAQEFDEYPGDLSAYPPQEFAYDAIVAFIERLKEAQNGKTNEKTV